MMRKKIYNLLIEFSNKINKCLMLNLIVLQCGLYNRNITLGC